MQIELITVLKIIGMIALGAMIGAVTNHLAIRMLFRPLEAKYIGKYRIPFTPGLIPKRRDELAANLGRTVVKHLVTPGGIGKRLRQPAMHEAVTGLVTTEIMKWLHSDVTVRTVVSRFIEQPEQKMRDKIGDTLEHELTDMMSGLKQSTIEEVVGQAGVDKIKIVIPEIVDALLKQTDVYFDSPEGKMQLEETTARFIQGKLGGGMFGMLLANINLVEMIQPEIKRVLQGESTRQFITQMVDQEIGQVMNRPIHTLLDETIEQQVIERIKSEVLNRIPLAQALDLPLHYYLSRFEEKIRSEFVPLIVDRLIEQSANHAERIMMTLDIESIVRDEVDLLDTQYLEEIVLSISRKEFRAITWLGGLLGGLIGMIQAILVIA